jgi:hypothetical protein
VKRPWPWQVWASVKPFIPLARDREAGERLIARLRAVEGDVMYPSHPWYPRLAGKAATFAHRMGVKDVTYQLPCVVASQSIRVGQTTFRTPCGRRGPALPAEARQIAGMNELRVGAVVLDEGEQLGEYPGLSARYRAGEPIPGEQKPRVFSGKPTRPGQIFFP